MAVGTDAATGLFRCSFCGRPDAEVGRLVAGPGVYICDECVGLCNHVLAQPVDTPAPRLHPWESMDDETLLAHIGRVATVAASVETDLGRWVAELRRRSVTWARIGEALGMTRQSAWERFASAC